MCSLNAEWNRDPKIWKAAEKLYTHIDNLELFPGLSAEERKPSMPGSGLAPGYTISRAILSDAGNSISVKMGVDSDGAPGQSLSFAAIASSPPTSRLPPSRTGGSLT